MLHVILGVMKKIGRFRAVYNPMCAYDPDTDKVVDYDARPYSRGWCHSESSEIIIGNMEINKDNRVKDKCLYSIEADDICFLAITVL